MTVEELIEELRQMPPTAVVWIQTAIPPKSDDQLTVWADNEIVSIAYRDAACIVRIEEA